MTDKERIRELELKVAHLEGVIEGLKAQRGYGYSYYPNWTYTPTVTTGQMSTGGELTWAVSKD